MAQAAAPERSNFFLTRCNLEPSTRLHDVAEPAATNPELAFKIALDEALYLIEQAVARIKQGEGADAARRELWAALSRMQTLVARDPGVTMAADDLYAAASALVVNQSAGSTTAVRHLRLLSEADVRLRTRLGTVRRREATTPPTPH